MPRLKPGLRNALLLLSWAAMPDSKRDTFCALPWVHIFLDSDGRYKACCEAVSQLPDLSEAIHTPPSAAHTWNQPYYKNIRQQMLAGEKPKACKACHVLEENGASSTRLKMNEFYSHLREGLIRSTRSDGSIPVKIRSADFRLGNVCNLKCRMCSPFYSRLLSDEWATLGYGAYPKNLVSDWYKNEEFVKNFFVENQDLEQLLIAGGEPLLSAEFFWLIDYLIETRKAQNLRISFHTNLTILPDGLLKKLQKFRMTNIRISIDGTAGLNSYVRHGSSWEKIKNNIALVNDWAKWPFTKVHLNVTVQAYNVLGLSKLIDFSLGFPNILPPSLNQLIDPEELSVDALPSFLKAEASASLQGAMNDFRERMPKFWLDDDRKKFYDEINETITYLQRPERPDLLQRFVARTKAHDRYRKQDIREHIPELASLFC